MQISAPVTTATGSPTQSVAAPSIRLPIDGSALAFTAMLILFAMLRSFPLSLGLAVIIGSANGLFIAVTTAILLSIVPDQFRGRVMSLYVMTWQLPSIGSLMLGAATDWVGLPVAVVTGALICIVFILGVTLRLPALRRF